MFGLRDEQEEDQQKAEDEDELGSTEPEALKLRPEDFAKASDFVKSYVRETRKIHNSDAKNELRRRESLGNTFRTENLQARAFRSPLVTKSGRPLKGESYHLTAMVPVLKETYHAHFNGTKKPTYERIKTEYMQE